MVFFILLFAITAIVISSALHIIITDGALCFPYTGLQFAYAITDI